MDHWLLKEIAASVAPNGRPGYAGRLFDIVDMDATVPVIPALSDSDAGEAQKQRHAHQSVRLIA